MAEDRIAEALTLLTGRCPYRDIAFSLDGAKQALRGSAKQRSSGHPSWVPILPSIATQRGNENHAKRCRAMRTMMACPAMRAMRAWVEDWPLSPMSASEHPFRPSPPASQPAIGHDPRLEGGPQGGRKAQSGLSAKRKTGHPCSPYAHPFRSQTHHAPMFLCFALCTLRFNASTLLQRRCDRLTARRLVSLPNRLSAITIDHNIAHNSVLQGRRLWDVVLHRPVLDPISDIAAEIADRNEPFAVRVGLTM